MPPCSVLLKMLKKEADIDRQITSFQLPFNIEYTPYETDFNERVKRYCKEGRNQNHLKISKIIVIGDVGVGKTSLVNRFCHKTFNCNYKATIGVDFEVERFDILGVPFNVQIWDTAGQERFKSLASSYYRAANVIIVVFDLGKLNSLANCKQWMEEALRENQNNMPPPYTFLIGNKLDSVSLSAYDSIQLQAVKLTEAIRAEYWPVSSKSGINVDSLFNRVAILAFQSSVLQEISTSHLTKIEIGKFNHTVSELNQRRLKRNCQSCNYR
uniref:Ras-related protein Rab-36 n=1 Tax=Rhodnius prolixus TaxID=13249 RepID=A0A4P6DG52_RHOPR